MTALSPLDPNSHCLGTSSSPPEESKRLQPAIAITSNPLTHLLNRFQPSPETVVLLLAVLIGGGTGMGVVTFHYLIELVHHLTLTDLMGKSQPGELGLWRLFPPWVV